MTNKILSKCEKANYESPKMMVINFTCTNILTVSDGNEGEWDPLSDFAND